MSQAAVSTIIPSNVHDDDEMEYFPSLPKLRDRASYQADKKKATKEACTKHKTRHPALLPGVFTLFCQHGNFKIIPA